MLSWFKQKKENVKTLGQLGEAFAQQEYKNRGCEIIAANFFNKKGLRMGEIDFIAYGKNAIIFVEVKTRAQANGKYGSPVESVNIFKQRKLLKTVKVFLLQNPQFVHLRPQIDVCVVLLNPLDSRPQNVTILANAVEDFS